MRTRMLTWLAATLLVAAVGAQTPAPSETIRSVRHKLEQLPYYGVFDYIAFAVDRGTVTLVGYTYDGHLKAGAQMAVKQASGVDEVDDRIEVLPSSPNDDRIRWATYYRI